MDSTDRFEMYVGLPGHCHDVRIDRSEGNYLMDTKGDRYIDFIAGRCVVNAGYGRGEIISRMAEYAEKKGYVRPSYINEGAVELAEKLADLTPGKLRQSFRVPSGTEAVEVAIKAARLYTGNSNIVSNEGSYHGLAYGTMSAGYESLGKPFEPLVPNFKRVNVPDGSESWYEEFEDTMSGSDAAAYLTETILTSQGVRIPGEEHYRRVREICDENDTLLILDEVANGFGRTGKMFAVEHYGIEPDLMALAKGMSSGYAPVGATVTKPDIGELMSSTEMGVCSTFGWVPSAIGATTANMKILEDESLPAQAAATGDDMAERLLRIEGVADVRQRGLLLGVELEDAAVAEVRSNALDNRLLVGTTNQEHILLLSPPLNIDTEYVRKGVERLKESIQMCYK